MQMSRRGRWICIGTGGNVVKATEDNPLVVIAQIRPIYVSFAVPEVHLAAIKKYRAAGTLKVEAMVDGGQRTVVGAVTFMNNTVDPTTGTIQLKATFQNADNALWPGQFVDVALTLTSEQAVVVPAQAVQAGQQGSFVFVVKPDNTIERRNLETSTIFEGKRIVKSGLKEGERVVSTRLQLVRPGMVVQPIEDKSEVGSRKSERLPENSELGNGKAEPAAGNTEVGNRKAERP